MAKTERPKPTSEFTRRTEQRFEHLLDISKMCIGSDIFSPKKKDELPEQLEDFKLKFNGLSSTGRIPRKVLALTLEDTPSQKQLEDFGHELEEMMGSEARIRFIPNPNKNDSSCVLLVSFDGPDAETHLENVMKIVDHPNEMLDTRTAEMRPVWLRNILTGCTALPAMQETLQHMHKRSFEVTIMNPDKSSRYVNIPVPQDVHEDSVTIPKFVPHELGSSPSLKNNYAGKALAFWLDSAFYDPHKKIPEMLPLDPPTDKTHGPQEDGVERPRRDMYARAFQFEEALHKLEPGIYPLSVSLAIPKDGYRAANIRNGNSSAPVAAIVICTTPENQKKLNGLRERLDDIAESIRDKKDLEERFKGKSTGLTKFERSELELKRRSNNKDGEGQKR